jgi:hypothetical protein
MAGGKKFPAREISGIGSAATPIRRGCGCPRVPKSYVEHAFRAGKGQRSWQNNLHEGRRAVSKGHSRDELRTEDVIMAKRTNTPEELEENNVDVDNEDEGGRFMNSKNDE